MAPKEGDGLGQDILSHSEDFRENWMEYHEDRLQELRDEFFRTSCHFCGKEFPTALKSFCHERFCKEGSKERFTCKNCGINFKSKEDLKHHGKRHRKPGGYFCFSCDTQFTSPAARIQHRITQHRVYQCQICLIKYKSSADYVRHILISHDDAKVLIPKEEVVELEVIDDDEQKYQDVHQDPLIIKYEPTPEAPIVVNSVQVEAEDVENTFDDFEPDHADSDSETENSDKLDNAESVKSKSTSKNSKNILKEDLKDPPDDAPEKIGSKYSCKLCRKTFSQIYSWDRHYKFHCPKRKPLRPHCKTCRKFFESEEMLENHAKLCMVTCAICNKKSHSKKNLLQHILSVHQNIKIPSPEVFCDKCGSKFRLRIDLEQHKMSDCGKKLPYECSICKKAFSLESKMRYHVKVVHGEKPFSCQYCEKRFRMREDMDFHVHNVHKRKSETFNCHLCPGIYEKERIYVKHMKTMHGVEMERPSGIHGCNYCRRMYITKERLQRHIKRMHTIDNKIHIKCTECKEMFSSKAAMQEHRTTMHKDKFVCHICNKSFMSRRSLPLHIKAKHTKEKIAYRNLYLCGRCGKAFRNRVAHQDHERTNCGKSFIYQCDVCKKKLATLGSLKTHKLTHTDNKAFPCSFCDKSFRTAAQKKSHERSHTGERPYKCTYCPKAFSHTSTLATHLTVHTGIKRYMCSGCGQRFTCLSNLRVHRTSHAETCGLVPNNTKPLEPLDDRMKLKDDQMEDEDE